MFIVRISVFFCYWCTVCVPSVPWYSWLGLLTCKNRLPYNVYCVGGDIKHCSIHPYTIPPLYLRDCTNSGCEIHICFNCQILFSLFVHFSLISVRWICLYYLVAFAKLPSILVINVIYIIYVFHLFYCYFYPIWLLFFGNTLWQKWLTSNEQLHWSSVHVFHIL